MNQHDYILKLKKEVQNWGNRCDRFLALYNARKDNFLKLDDIVSLGLQEEFGVQNTIYIILDRKKYFNSSFRYFSGFDDNDPFSEEYRECICFRSYFEALNVFNFLNFTYNCNREDKHYKILSLKEFTEDYKLVDSKRGRIYVKK
ncbi:MAG: hypothetical protein IJ772_04700 [Bacilli bacterium]|nr:hypothetical protein [Bacilli bacterium]